MSAKKSFFFKLSVVAAVFLIAMVVISSVMISEESPFTPLVGVPHDWTHRHLVYSNPGTGADALAQGRFEQWYKIANDPRYQMQQIKRNPALRALTAAPDFFARTAMLGAFSEAANASKRIRKIPSETVEKDWSMNLGAATVGAGQYPAKYSFDTTTASCSDFVVYNTGATGSTTQANIIAYTNIYSSCGTSPTVYWSYHTGGGTASTSVVLSGDGAKVAFMESGTPSGSATLRIVKWKASEGTDFSTPVVPNATYTYINAAAGAGGNTAWNSTNCPAADSCMISVKFQAGTNTDTTSAPYYDYSSDTIYVGDSGTTTAGYLHKFTGVFNGAPGEVVSSGTNTTWPAPSGHTGALTSPVYDSSHGLVFFGQYINARADSVSSTGTVVQGPVVGFSTHEPLQMVDAPLVDPAAGEVYYFVGDNGTTNSAVVQLPWNFTGTSTVTPTIVGAGSTTIPIYSGTFDNAYYTSTSATPTGHLWVCGNAGGAPALYPIPITSGVMTTGTITPQATVSNATTTCSPVTEFNDNTTDYIMVSPQTQTATPLEGCTASTGCVISFTVSGTTATRSGSGPFTGGASGMIVDALSTAIGGSLNIYFGILGSQSCTGAGGVGTGTGGCAIQAGMVSP